MYKINQNKTTGVREIIQLTQHTTPPLMPMEELGDAGGNETRRLLNKYIPSSKMSLLATHLESGGRCCWDALTGRWPFL